MVPRSRNAPSVSEEIQRLEGRFCWFFAMFQERGDHQIQEVVGVIRAEETALLFQGADAHIYREKYFPFAFVVEHTVLPYDIGDCPEALVCVGPGRSGSTALLALMMSHPAVDRGYYQPWKALVRHGLTYGEFVIPGQADGVKRIFAKETLGPFSREAEEFNPVDLLLKSGFPLEKISLIVLMREPLATYASNLKFEGGIDPALLVSNYEFSWGLYKEYSRKITTIPLAYELASMNGEEVTETLFEKLDLPFQGMAFDPETLKFVSQGGKFVAGEAQHPVEYQEIIEPTFSRGVFQFAGNQAVNLESFAKYASLPGAAQMTREELISTAARVQAGCQSLYEEFCALSQEVLMAK